MTRRHTSRRPAGMDRLATGLVVALLSSVLVLVTADPAAAATLVVNTTADHADDGCAVGPGDCTLREAINASNASVGVLDTVEFAIPAAGVQTMTLTSDLPPVNDPAVIDATTQYGSASLLHRPPLIELDGGGARAIGFWVLGGGTTIKGFDIRRFTNSGILVQSDNNVIRANYIGTTADGTTASTGFSFGALRIQSQGNTVGGTSPADRNVVVGGFQIQNLSAINNTVQGNYIGTNAAGSAGLGGNPFTVGPGAGNIIGGAAPGAGNVISGMTGNGLAVTGSNTLVEGNLIGTDATGTVAVPNSSNGLDVSGGTGTIVGTAAGPGNVIAGNTGEGIRIQTSGTAVANNHIGTTAGGAPLGNGSTGVMLISASATGNVIGGVSAGAGNVIANNSAAGVGVLINAVNNAVEGNRIFNNGGAPGLGIDLGVAFDGVTPNDVGDADAGSNNLQNFPVLTAAGTTGPDTSVAGTLNSAASTTFRVEFFSSPSCDASGNGEGANFLGSDDVTTDGGGNGAFNTTLATATPVGDVVTATATDPAGNTSEFSACETVTVAATVPDAPTGVTATNGAAPDVSWTAPVDDGGSPVTDYTVTASPGGDTWTVAAPTTNLSATGLAPGDYTFTVIATNTVGDSVPSAPSNTATVPATVPDPPTAVAATNGTNPDVSWTAPVDDGGSPVTDYTVTASPGGDTWTVAAPTTNLSATGLAPGDYTFTVIATNTVGDSVPSAPSNTATVPAPVPATVPDPPTGVTAVGGVTARVSWTSPVDDGGSPITGYTVRSVTAGTDRRDREAVREATFTVGSNATNLTITSLAPGSYVFTVVATNAIGTSSASAPSNAVSVTGPPPPVEPPVNPPAAPPFAARPVVEPLDQPSLLELATILPTTPDEICLRLS